MKCGLDEKFFVEHCYTIAVDTPDLQFARGPSTSGQRVDG
jgi:hypothetical protein